MRERQNVVTFLLFFFLLLSSAAVTSYTPVEHLAVNCGGSANVSSNDHRNWKGDNNSTLFSLTDPEKATQSIKLDAQAGSNPSIPYDTARLSRSEFSYSFPVTDGQKFIRLFFYPSSYKNSFLHSDAIFSVKAGPHTHLKDFKASVNADAGASLNVAEPDGAIVREYLVNVGQGRQKLTVTFTPSLSSPNAYAFINGIEIISMPDYLYYTAPDDQQGMMLNGGTSWILVNNINALQTMYRINVGGSQIPAKQDTRMFRYWDQDIAYLTSGERPHSVSAGFGLKQELDQKDYTNYTAPDDVYLTARNYGMNVTSKYYVTWEFEVDSNFTYMVRLHFCEFDDVIRGSDERVFQIFISDNLVESHADVFMWSGNTLIPVHQDYAVSMLSEGNLMKKLNLSIKLQPDPIGKTVYRDVLLNGIEILKINDNNDNLAGPNPDPIKPSTMNRKKAKVISITVGATSGFIVLCIILLLIFWRMIRAPVKEGSSWGEQKSTDSSKKIKSHGSTLSSDLCRYVSIDEIKEATNNFDDIFIVGAGGFGNVYKGYIDRGTIPVAIKRLKQGSQQGFKEFQTEIEMLSQLRHHHLVSLVGYCNDNNEMILVYEFMTRGTLRDQLYDSDHDHQHSLSFDQRLEICLGAARGLHYLHTGAKHAIIHRDIKSTNILIDENWMAKISDFGLSKIGPSGITRSNINISTAVKGSIGYLDPEYYMCQRLTEKSDVYSFGVVLLEVLCGRPPILRAVERQQQNLVEWVRRCVNDNEINGMLDPFIRESITGECLKTYIEIALQCLADDRNDRPSMGDVMLGLEFVTELQNKVEKTRLGGALNEEITVEEGSLFFNG